MHRTTAGGWTFHAPRGTLTSFAKGVPPVSEDFVQVNQTSAGESARTVVRLRCPRCKRQGVLEPLAAPDVYVEEWFENSVGLRCLVGYGVDGAFEDVSLSLRH
jgi:hypothetical protein